MSPDWPRFASTATTKLREVAPGIVTILLVILLWESIARITPQGNVFFPSVPYTVDQFFIYQSEIVSGVQITMKEILLGWLISVVLGSVLGILIAESFTIRQATTPLLIFFYSLPHALLAPLFILWFGFNIYGIALFVSWYGFFPVLINTITGFTQVDEEFYHMGEVVGASRWQMIKYVKFWNALPHMVAGIKTAIQFSIIGAVIAEFLVSTGGLAQQLVLASHFGQTGRMFSILIVLMVFAVIFYGAVSRLIDYVIPQM